MTSMSPSNAACRRVSLIALLATLAIAAPAHAQQTAATDASALACAEDKTETGAPTISQRFNPKEMNDDGSAFALARVRALRYCAAQPCTTADRSLPRTAHAFGVAAMKRGQLIVGFRCIPQGETPAANPPQVTLPLAQPADLDATLAQARAQCAPATSWPELLDLQQKDSGFLAVFRCGS
jgi:hypothetical protein